MSPVLSESYVLAHEAAPLLLTLAPVQTCDDIAALFFTASHSSVAQRTHTTLEVPADICKGNE